jgi:outer membrane biosynthesis protein TonB
VESRNRIYIVVLSILLHILLLYLLEGALKLNLIGIEIPENKIIETDPIVFDLQEPNYPREVIETPEDAKVVDKQKKANFLSDKNALARNPETNPEVDLGEAFSRGELDTHDLPAAKGSQGKPDQPKEPEPQREEGKESDKEADKEFQDFSVDGIFRSFYENALKSQRETDKPGVKERLPGIKHDNQKSRAPDMGGLSFNTYDWEYAPYLLALKNRIQRNIFPPVAFTHLGLISGETLLRFKIYPNGEMRDLEVLGYAGHKSLRETSINAIEISAPFPALPADFPEDYLEVTGRFTYYISKKH